MTTLHLTTKEKIPPEQSPAMNALLLAGVAINCIRQQGSNGQTCTLKGGNTPGTGWMISQSGQTVGFSDRIVGEVNQLVSCTFQKIQEQQYQINVQSGDLKGYEIRIVTGDDIFQIKEKAIQAISKILLYHQHSGTPITNPSVYNSWNDNPFAALKKTVIENPTPAVEQPKKESEAAANKQNVETPLEEKPAEKVEKESDNVATPTQNQDSTAGVPTPKEDEAAPQNVEGKQGSEECGKKKPCVAHKRLSQFHNRVLKPICNLKNFAAKKIHKFFHSRLKGSRGTPPGADPKFKFRYQNTFKESLKLQREFKKVPGYILQKILTGPTAIFNRMVNKIDAAATPFSLKAKQAQANARISSDLQQKHAAKASSYQDKALSHKKAILTKSGNEVKRHHKVLNHVEKQIQKHSILSHLFRRQSSKQQQIARNNRVATSAFKSTAESLKEHSTEATLKGGMGAAAATVLLNKEQRPKEVLKALTLDPAVDAVNHTAKSAVYEGIVKGLQGVIPAAKHLPCADAFLSLIEVLNAGQQEGLKGIVSEGGAVASASIGASVIISFGGSIFLAGFVGGVLSIKAKYTFSQLCESMQESFDSKKLNATEFTEKDNELIKKMLELLQSAKKAPPPIPKKESPKTSVENAIKKEVKAAAEKPEKKSKKTDEGNGLTLTKRKEKSQNHIPNQRGTHHESVISLGIKDRKLPTSILSSFLKSLGLNFSGIIPHFTLSIGQEGSDPTFSLDTIDLTFCELELKKGQVPTPTAAPILPKKNLTNKMGRAKQKINHFAKHAAEVAQIPKEACKGLGKMLDKASQVMQKKADKLQARSKVLSKKAQQHIQEAKEAHAIAEKFPSSLQQKENQPLLPTSQAYRDLKSIESQHKLKASKLEAGSKGFEFFENTARVAGGALSGAANSLKTQGDNLGNTVKGSAGGVLVSALTNLNQFKDAESVAKGLVFEPAKSLVISAGKTAFYDGIAGATAATIKAKASEKTAKKLIQKIPGADKIFMVWDLYNAGKNEGKLGIVREGCGMAASLGGAAYVAKAGAFAAGIAGAVAAFGVKWFVNGLYYENYIRDYQISFEVELRWLKESTKKNQWVGIEGEVQKAIDKISICGDEDEQQDRHNAVNHFLCEAEYEQMNAHYNTTGFLDLERVAKIENTVQSIAKLTPSYRSRYFHEPRYFYGNQSGPLLEKLKWLKANFVASITPLMESWKKFRKLMELPEINANFRQRDLEDVMSKIEKGYPARFFNVADRRTCFEHIRDHSIELKQLLESTMLPEIFDKAKSDIIEFENAIYDVLRRTQG